jgi:hypothetical protein
MAQKNRKLLISSLLRAEGFSYSLHVRYGGLGISKLQFFFSFWSLKLWIRILIRIHLKCWIRIPQHSLILRTFSNLNFFLTRRRDRSGSCPLVMPDRQLASQPDLLDPEAERRILRCSSVDPFLPLMFLSLSDPDP